MTTDITEQKEASICYPYLYGYLEQSLRHLAYDLSRKGLMIESAVPAAQALVDSVIKKAYKAEREHTNSMLMK